MDKSTFGYILMAFCALTGCHQAKASLAVRRGPYEDHSQSSHDASKDNFIHLLTSLNRNSDFPTSFTNNPKFQLLTAREGEDLEGTGKDLGGPGKDLGGPGKDLGGPGKDLGGPGKDLGGPGKDLGGPGKDLGGPGKDLGGPGKDLGGPAKGDGERLSADKMAHGKTMDENEVDGSSLESLWFLRNAQVLGIDPVDIPRYLGAFYLPEPELIDNPDCIEDLQILANTSESQSLNVMMMIDSWGKIPDGLLSGNTGVLGSFDECLKTEIQRFENLTGFIEGQYCHISYKKSNTPVENEKNVRMPVILGNFTFLLNDYSYGTCIPSSCTKEDLWVSLAQNLEVLNLNVRSITCQTRDPPTFDFNAGGIVTVSVIITIGALIVIGSILDIWIHLTRKEELRTGKGKYPLAFSAYTNLPKMFHISTTPNRDTITCIYGLRVLSMTWVILGHQYLLTAMTAGNKFMVPDLMNNDFPLQAVMNAFPSVDTFLVMSGLFVSHGILGEQDRTGRFSIGLYYIHRVIRLVPPILLLSNFMASFPKVLVRGPLAPEVDTEGSLADMCRKYWWRDVLFISNFEVDDKRATCLGVTWYTSVDFQLYCIVPLILLPFIWKRLSAPNIRLAWLTFVTLATVIIPGAVIGVYELPPGMTIFASSRDIRLYSKYVYYKAWCRASPYLVGIWLSYILRLNNRKNFRLQVWQVITGWVISSGLGVAVVYGMYNYNQYGSLPQYNGAISIIYGSLHTLLWGIAVAWLIFACHNGYGGPINTFLSHPGWQPLSRLTYCMFLIAIPVQTMIFVYDVHFPSYFSHLNKIIEAVGVLFISGLGAVVVSLFVEAPVLALERLFLRRPPPAKNNRAGNELPVAA